MTAFDLLFLTLFFATIVTLFVAAGLAFRRQFERARLIFRTLLLCICFYMAVVVGVSLLLPRQIIKADAPQCFDDWCISVAGLMQSPGEGGVRYSVDLRLSSRARRVAQRENNLSVYLTDGHDRRYDPIRDSSARPFNILLQPQESVIVNRSFVVPVSARDIGLVITHEGGFPIGWFIIGYDTWFRKPAVLPLP